MKKEKRRILESRLVFLKAKVNLVEVLKEFMPDKLWSETRRDGISNCFQWDCPFCSDDNASFKAMHGKETYYCFNCNANGDAITFLMCHKKMTFMDAIEFLAKKYDFKLEDK